MYAPFFGLSQEPFSIAPDPHFLYMSEQHREALAHLLYGLGGGGGFVLLTGEIGAGKTTVCRCFLEQVPAATAVAYIFNPKLTVIELLQTICGEFGIAAPADASSQKAHVDALNAFLLRAHAEGRRAVLVIDEAQSLSADVLEQLRLLTNLETAERKLLQIVLIGQPELREMLARPGLEQLAQRVIARYHLGALSEVETQHYIRHRLSVAGPGKGLPFDTAAMARIHRLSGGVPRRINLLADRALLGAYAQGRAQADRRTVDQAAIEVFDARALAARRGGPASFSRPAVGAVVGVLLVVGGLLALLVHEQRQHAQDLLVAMAGSVGPPAGQPRVDRAVAGSSVVGVSASPPAAAGITPGTDATSPATSPATTSDTTPPSAAVAAPAASPFATAATAAASTAVQTPAASAEPGRDTDALLAAATRSEAIAWRELALRWQVAIGEGEPCAVAAQASLGCFSASSGGLSLVRLLARPGIVTLRGANGAALHAVLTGLDDDSATLQAGARRFELALPALARVWQGDFSTFWRLPPGAAPAERSAEREREWLAAQLRRAGIDGAGSLRDRVSAFQIVQGLNPDGLAGPQTLMRLNRVAGVAEPRLDGVPTPAAAADRMPAATASTAAPDARATGR